MVRRKDFLRRIGTESPEGLQGNMRRGNEEMYVKQRSGHFDDQDGIL